MSEALIRTPADRLAKTQGKSLRDLVRAKTRRSLLLVDASDSMSTRIRTGERRIDALRKVVKVLRETHPVPVAAFGVLTAPNMVCIVDSVPEPSGGTPLHAAITFGHEQGATHLVVVTDGEPDSERLAFEAATRFGGVIDVFFIGDEGAHGADFCRRLAAATGGNANVTDLGGDAERKQLTGKIAGLLGDGSL